MNRTLRKAAATVVLAAALSVAAACGSQPTVVPQPTATLASLESIATIETVTGTSAKRSSAAPATPTARSPVTTRAKEGTRVPLVIPQMTPTPPATEAPAKTVLAPEPTPADPSPKTAPTDLLDADDQACLPDGLTEQGIINWLATTDQDSRSIVVQCMSENGQRRMYSLSPDARWLGPNELTCVWKAVGSFWTTDREPVIVDGQDMANLATDIVRAYCINNRRGEAEEIAYIDDLLIRMDLATIYCMVDTIGGPAEFASWMVENPRAMYDMKEALNGEGECGWGEPVD